MGWKSTITITRERAIELIMTRIMTANDCELANALESLGFGDDTRLPYYGYNFSIGTTNEDDLSDQYNDEQ